MAKIGGSFAGAEGHAEFSKEEMKQAEIWAEKRERKGEKEQKEREKKMAPKGNPITSFKPPKEWFDKMFKQIKEKNPSYDDKQIADTIGDIWYHKIDEQKRIEIRNKYSATTIEYREGMEAKEERKRTLYKDFDSPKKVTVFPPTLHLDPPMIWFNSEVALIHLDNPEMDEPLIWKMVADRWFKELNDQKRILLIRNYGSKEEKEKAEDIITKLNL